MSKLAASLAAICLALPSLNCGLTCKQLQTEYEKAKAGEVPESEDQSADEKEGESPAHIAVGVRTKLIENLASELVGGTIETVVETSRTLDVGGAKALQVRSIPKVKEFELDRREDACRHCFRISGKLDGSLAVKIPVLGDREVPLNGEFQFVAPVTVGPGPADGTGALFLDLGEAIRENAAPIVISVGGLRESWQHTIENILSTELADSLFEKLEPVRLLTFKTPDLGIPGFSIEPVGLEIDEEGEAIRLLVSTNLPLRMPPDASKLASAATPAEDRNLALAVPPDFVVAGVARAFRRGDVGRRYTTKGEESSEGPVHIALRNFQPKKDDAAKNAIGYSFGFDAFHLAEPAGPCFGFQGVATGKLNVEKSNIRVSLDDVTFTDTPNSDVVLDAANWMSAKFLKSGAKIAEASLAKQNIELPTGKYDFAKLQLRAEAGFLTLSALAQ